MPVGRYSRHTVAGLRQELREKVVYANDLSEGSGTPSLTNIGVSPAWQHAHDSDSDVMGDLKVPIDRVPNTPIDVKLVFTVDQEGGMGNVLWNFSYLIASEGVDLTGARVTPAWLTSAPPANVQKTTDPVRIASSSLDGLLKSVDIQFQVQREGTHASDTHGGNALILKVVFEYTAYT